MRLFVPGILRAVRYEPSITVERPLGPANAKDMRRKRDATRVQFGDRIEIEDSEWRLGQ